MDKLLSTGSKTIVECSHNTLWGCGKPLQDQSCLIPNTWNGDNLLGQILMAVRNSEMPLMWITDMLNQWIYHLLVARTLPELMP